MSGSVVVLLSSRRGGLGTCEREALRGALRCGADLDLPVVAISAGDERALTIALRAGCTRAIEVEVDAVSLDYLGLARSLAPAVGDADPALVLCGDQSETRRRGAVGQAVAELLEIAHLSGVLAVDVVDGQVRCRANLDGKQRWFAASLPVLLCVRSAGRPAPTTRRSANEIERRSFDGAGRDGQTRVISIPPRGGAAITESAVELVRRMREDHLL